MKLKHKLILDGVLLVLLIVLMDYSLTGGLLHELLGILILVGFIVHVAVKANYIIVSASANPFYPRSGTSEQNLCIITFAVDWGDKHN